MGVSISSEIHRIAVMRSLYLGDVISATAALRALKERFPHAEVTMIGLPWFEELLTRLDAVDRFEPFPGFPGLPEVPFDRSRTTRFIEAMRARNFDLVLQMHGDGSVSNSFAEALGGTLSVGYSTAGRDDERLSFALPWREGEHEVLRWLRLVKVLGAEAEARVVFPLSERDRDGAKRLLAGTRRPEGPLVGIHCGAKLPSRRWPVERFARVANQLAAETGAAIVLTGSEAERPLTEELQSHLDCPVTNLSGLTDLGALGAIIDALDLLVTNDTGVSHLAAATGTRSVVLFGPSDPNVWAPLDRKRHWVIDAAAGRERTEGSLMDLDSGSVIEACLRMLGPGHVAARRPLAAVAGTASRWESHR